MEGDLLKGDLADIFLLVENEIKGLGYAHSSWMDQAFTPKGLNLTLVSKTLRGALGGPHGPTLILHQWTRPQQ